MIELPLASNKYPGMVALIDDEDWCLVEGLTWYVVKDHSTFYAHAHTGNTKIKSMHQIVMGGNGEMIDHIDRNGLNNQKANLRFATNSANQANGKHRSNKFGYRGVSQHGNGYRAQIKVNKSAIYIGSFSTPEDAARAYDDALYRVHGEHATFNFSREG